MGFEQNFNQNGIKSRNYFQTSLNGGKGKQDLQTVAEEAT
jgi:hypothetical protein|tara:strand:+ start:170 stop:289 length:120 start_codon:yes stop_codon:yes gene_type:complete